MSFGRGRGGRGGGSGGAGRGALADLSLGTLSFADLLATSRADVGGVLYPTEGVNIPVTDLPAAQEEQTVALEVDRWIYPTFCNRWIVDGVVKPHIAAKKIKSCGTPFVHQFSKLHLKEQSSSCTEDWLYSDRYKSNQNVTHVNQYNFLQFLDKSFFPPDLWTSFNEGKKKTVVRNTKKKKKKNIITTSGQLVLSGLVEDEDGADDVGGDKDDKEDTELEVVEEEEIDEDDPDYDNNYFDNGDDDEGMDSAGDAGDDAGVF